MRELSLFSGAGGGLLASKMLGWETVGYVESDDYCQQVLAQRVKDGWLDVAPIFGDIAAFADQGYANQYRGMVDVITAGFPCQPWSCAGKRLGEQDDRNLWPRTIRVIETVSPRWVFLENVPALLSGTHGYFGTILQELAEIGFDARWEVLSASQVGAPHIRKRVWVVGERANPDSVMCQWR